MGTPGTRTAKKPTRVLEQTWEEARRPVSESAGVASRDNLDDASLVELVSKSNAAALAVLYERHGGVCYRLAHRVTCDHALAEDAVQEAFTGLWRAPGTYFPGHGSVRAWLLGLTHHKAVDLVRRETAQRRRQDADAARQALDPPGDDPAEEAWSRIQAQAVWAALAELPEEQRQALALAYFGGYTQREIAELTGVPLGTVKTRMFAAMRRLRGRLSARDGLAGEESR